MVIEWDYTKEGDIIIAIDRKRLAGWYRSLSSARRWIKRKYNGRLNKGSSIFWTW